jgi:hypothetical protein
MKKLILAILVMAESSLLSGADIRSLYPAASGAVDIAVFGENSFILARRAGNSGGVALFSLDGKISSQPLASWDYGNRDAKCILPADEPVKMIESPGGGYLILSELKSHAARGSAGVRQSAVWLIKIAATGKEEWSRVHGDSTMGFKPFDVIPTGDSGYLITGAAVENTVIWKNLIIKTDSRGEIRWKNVLPSSSYAAVSRIARTTGGYFLFGYDRVQDRVNYLLTRTDLQGKSLWQKNYPGFGDMLRLPLVSLEDGRFYAHVKSENRAPRLILFNEGSKSLSDGTVQGLRQTDRLESSVSMSDGSTVLCGSAENENSDMLLCRVGPGNKLLWRKTIHLEVDDLGLHVLRLNDGFLVIGMMSYSYNYSTQTYSYSHVILKTDMEGNRQWHEPFSVGTADQVADAVMLADNRCAILMNTIRNSRQEALVLFTEPGGRPGRIPGR